MSELIIEQVDFDEIENKVITESINGHQQKNYFITGKYLSADEKNGNGRIYPKPIIIKEVNRLNESKIPQNRLIGELEHSNTTTINLERVSHLIKELKMEGNYAIGKSLVLDTPMGKIAKALIDGGVKLGVSSRGVGTLKESIVQNDFVISTIDIVSDPSGKNCFVDGILESKKEWVMENGILTEKELEDTLHQVNKIIIEHQFSIEDRQSAFLKLFTDSLNKIKNKLVL